MSTNVEIVKPTRFSVEERTYTCVYDENGQMLRESTDSTLTYFDKDKDGVEELYPGYCDSHSIVTTTCSIGQNVETGKETEYVKTYRTITNGNPSVVDRKEVRYRKLSDGTELILTTTVFLKNGMQNTSENVYDSNNNLLRSIYRDSSITKTNYFENNLLVKTVQETVKSGAIRTTKYEYDSHGNNTLIIDGNKVTKITYTYNNNDVIIVKTTTVNDGYTEVQHFTQNGELSCTYVGKFNHLKPVLISKYYKDGRIASKETFTDSGKQRIDYKYEDHEDGTYTICEIHTNSTNSEVTNISTLYTKDGLPDTVVIRTSTEIKHIFYKYDEEKRRRISIQKYIDINIHTPHKFEILNYTEITEYNDEERIVSTNKAWRDNKGNIVSSATNITQTDERGNVISDKEIKTNYNIITINTSV